MLWVFFFLFKRTKTPSCDFVLLSPISHKSITLFIRRWKSFMKKMGRAYVLATGKSKMNHLTSCLERDQPKNSPEWIQTKVWWHTWAVLSFWTSRYIIFLVHCREWIIQLQPPKTEFGSWGINYSHHRQTTVYFSFGEMTKLKQRMGLAYLLKSQNLLNFLSLGLSGHI